MGKIAGVGKAMVLVKTRKRYVEDHYVFLLACTETNTFEFRVKDGSTAVFEADHGIFPSIDVKKPSRSHRALYKIKTKEYDDEDFVHGKILKMTFLRWMKPSTYKRFKAGKLKYHYKCV